ncbi:MAG: GAF domain-containing protein, partial [Longimicrobiales bacterium]
TKVDAETLGVARVSVWFFTSDRGELVCHTLYTLSDDAYGAGVRLESVLLPRYFAALHERRVIAAHDALTHEHTAEFADDYLNPLGITSMLDVPIWRHGEMMGVVCHEHTGQARRWTPGEQDFAASIADMVSLALEAAERKQAEEELRTAEQEAQRMADRMRAVAAAASGVIGARSRTDLRNVLEAACRSVMDFDAFFMQGYDAETHTFLGFGGNDAGVFSPPNIIAAAGTPGERVVRERRSLVTLRSTDPASLGAEITGTGRRSESVIRTPILRGDDVVGFLSVQSYTPDLYTSQDVQVTEAIASLASTALSNVELLAERSAVEEALRGAERDAQNMADRMRAVASAAAGVVAADSLDALHDVLRDACRKVISFDAFTFALYDAATDELHFLLGYDGDVITPADTISAKGVPAEKVIRERRSLVTLKSSDPNAAGAKLMGTGRRSESIIRSPILSGEDVLGVLAVHSYTPDLYTPHDVEVLETVTSLAATAIKKVRLASERAAAEEALRASEENYRT